MLTSALRRCAVARGAVHLCPLPAQRCLAASPIVLSRARADSIRSVAGALVAGRRAVHFASTPAASAAAAAHTDGASASEAVPAAATTASAAERAGELAEAPATPTAACATDVDAGAQPSADGKGGATPTATTPVKAAEARQPPPTRESLWRRGWRALKSEGKDFTIFYTPFYIATFIFLYAAFATGTLHKEKLLEFVLSYMGSWVDREALQKRIAAWDAWVNLGFAVAINELIEVVRLPVVFFLYYVTKPYSNHLARWLARSARRLRWSRKSRGDGTAAA